MDQYDPSHQYLTQSRRDLLNQLDLFYQYIQWRPYLWRPQLAPYILSSPLDPSVLLRQYLSHILWDQ